jgi:hypothetical protein
MKKLWNWRLWIGLVVAVLALGVYVAMFFRTRDVLWVSLALFVISLSLLITRLRRAYGQRESYRGQVAGPILTVLSVLILALFGLVVHEIPKHFAEARNAPKVGQPAPGFTLVDTSGQTLSLAEALSSPLGPAHAPKAVLLVFYRGYW